MGSPVLIYQRIHSFCKGKNFTFVVRCMVFCFTLERVKLKQVTAVETWCQLPERANNIFSASFFEPGLPSTLPRKNTNVSAERIIPESLPASRSSRRAATAFPVEIFLTMEEGNCFPCFLGAACSSSRGTYTRNRKLA